MKRLLHLGYFTWRRFSNTINLRRLQFVDMAKSESEKTTTSKFDLPGLNLPINHSPPDLFPSPLDDRQLENGNCSLPLTTLREFSMQHIINSLTDKPGWEVKVFDDSIVSKWKNEATSTEGADVTEKMMDHVIAELRWKAFAFKETGSVVVYNGHVVKSDSAVSDDLKVALQNAVRPLENVPDVHKDWHPGSSNQVLDLVHPSLFPLIYGRSRVVENRLIGLENCIEQIGEGKTVEIRDEEETEIKQSRGWGSYTNSKPWSKHFQWLPCDIEVSDGQAKILSYINNLHPHKHQDLYGIIADIVTKTIPLWNLTLAKPRNSKDLRFQFELEFDPDPENIEDEDKPPRREDEDEDDYWERTYEWGESMRRTVKPEPKEFDAPEESADNVFDLTAVNPDSSFQVIVKLANIELTPDKPEYEGGTWHVEGQLNEHICATALYYYDNENISDSHLAFRQHSEQEDTIDIGYPQNVHGWLSELYGIENEGPVFQDVGTILCKEGRLLTFPNILQHQVQPFKLADPSRPGHRKILALFLIDPHIRIIGTANVPPQQRHWWSEKVNDKFSKTENALGALSNELKDKIFSAVDDFPIGLNEAKEIRIRLMEERKTYVLVQNESWAKAEISLCEH